MRCEINFVFGSFGTGFEIHFGHEPQKHPQRHPGDASFESEIAACLCLDWLWDNWCAGDWFAFGFADVDAAFEEGSIFNADTCCGDVSGKGALAADVDAVGRHDVAADLPEDDDFAGGDVGGYLAVSANRDAVAGEVDGAFNLAVNEEGLGAADLAFDDEALADGGLFSGGGCCSDWRLIGGGGWGGSHWLWHRCDGGGAWLAGFPHDVY